MSLLNIGSSIIRNVCVSCVEMKCFNITKQNIYWRVEVMCKVYIDIIKDKSLQYR